MAQGVRKAFHTTFGLSTTGVAGPTGGTKRLPLEEFSLEVAVEKTWVRKEDLKGSRREIKEKAAERALEFFCERLVRSGGSRFGKTSVLM